MASIRKRGGRYYVSLVDETGRRVERRIPARTTTEARRIAEEMEVRVGRARLGLDSNVEPPTLNEVWKEYEPVARQKRSYADIRRRWVKHIQPVFGTWRLHQVRPSDIEAFMARKQRDGLSPQTAEHLRVHLAAIYTFAINKMRAFSGVNPARIADRPEIQKHPPKFLEIDEVPRMLAKVSEEWRPFFAIAVFCGLRKGEICGLQVTDVDLQRRIIIVARSYSHATKTNRVRFAPITEELLPYVKAAVKSARSEWLFSRPDGSQLNEEFDASGMFKRAMIAAKIVDGYWHRCITRGKRKGCGFEERRADGTRTPCPKCGALLWVRGVPKNLSFKDLRSTQGTHAYEATGDIRYVQKLLGHGDARTTERYARLRDKHMHTQAERVRLIGSGATPNASKPASASHPHDSDEIRRNETKGDETP